MQEDIVIPAVEAAEFGEYKRQKKIFRIREDIARMEINADVSGMTCDVLKEKCAVAKRLALHAVNVNPLFVKQAKALLSGSFVKVVCKACKSGENSFKSGIYEVKQAYKDGADEVEITISSSLVRSGNFQIIKRFLKKCVRIAKGRCVSVSGEENVLTEAELCSAYKTAAKSGVKAMRIPRESNVISLLKGEADELVFKSRADNKQQFEFLSDIGVMRISTDFADEIAGELMSEAANAEV